MGELCPVKIVKEMRIVFVIVLSCLIGGQLFAQGDQTIFRKANRGGLFVSPFVEQGPLVEDWRTSTGGGVGIILGDAFVGFYGQAGLDYDKLILSIFEISSDFREETLYDKLLYICNQIALLTDGRSLRLFQKIKGLDLTN